MRERLILDYFRFLTRNDQDMRIAVRRVLNVIDLFVDVALHAAAERRVKLSYVANLHLILSF